MKTSLSYLLCGVIFLLTASSFKPDNSAAIDNYYYYQGKQIPLFKSSTDLFISLKQPLSSEEMSLSLGTDRNNFLLDNFDANETMQIIKFNSPQSEESAHELINSLKRNPVVDYASAVYSLPTNIGSSKVQLGCINEIIVQFKSDVSSIDASNYIERNNLQIISKLDLSGGETYMLKVSPDNNSLDVANDIFESGIANYSEPNFFQTNLLQYTPNDQFFPNQWSIKNSRTNVPDGILGTFDCDMDADSAWDISLGSSAVQVSIVDTGIDTLHPDLSAKIVNGKGYNFYSNNTNSMDDNNHGTCCAGIVGASQNNTIGVSGIAPNARLFGIKIFNSAGNTTTDAIINAMIYTKTSGCWISSNSWGGGSPISAADNAIFDGVTTGRGGKGIVYCFATGNENNSAISWPSNNPNVIAVGGISPCNQRKSTSSCDGENWWGANYGTGLTIVAPCTKVYATDRRGSAGYSSTDYFATFNGTSSATPNTSGVCALVLGLDSSMRWDTLRSRVARLADKVGAYSYTSPGSLSLGGWNNQMGYGRINAYSIMKYTLEHMAVPVPANISVSPEGFYNTLTGKLNMKDTVTVYLRSSSPPYSLVDSGKAVIDSLSLTGSVLFNNAPTGTYFIVVKHRNSIETWSKWGGESYTVGSVLNYSFTSFNSQAYGNNTTLVGTVWTIYSGDVNRNGLVTLTDILSIFNDAGIFSSGYISTDVNGDRFATLADILLAYNNATKFVISVTP